MFNPLPLTTFLRDLLVKFGRDPNALLTIQEVLDSCSVAIGKRLEDIGKDYNSDY